MPSIDVCLTPELLHQYELKGKIAVITDVLRATSVMVTALAHGVEEIIPVEDLETCRSYREQGYVIAGERGGETAEGFDLGNSPLVFLNEAYAGKKLAATTTNGTLAIERAAAADQRLVGALLNVRAIADYLKKQPEDVVIICAGWKGKFNLEDTLFAGALVKALANTHEKACDAPLSAEMLFDQAEGQLENYLKQSAHAQRLEKLEVLDDIAFCSQLNRYAIVPIMKGKRLITL